jgi:formylmethanofuran dehydrogenase subunit E
MTILIEDALPEQEFASPNMVKCSWCGEIIRLDGNELALAMCQPCYDRMLGEFLRAQQAIQTPTRPSDR